MRKFYDRYLKNLHPAIGIIFFLITVVFFICAMFWASWDNLKKAEDIKQRVQEREEKLEKEILDSQLITDNSGQEVLNMMEQHANQTVAASAIIGISCWGDEFMDSNDSPIYSYPVILSQRLAENGKNIPVVNRGLYEAGTLSQLRLAGVDEAEIQNYINVHTIAYGGENPAAAEINVRTFTAEELTRTDREYFPIIFMGFYGGWNNDPQELIAQQEKILATFDGNQQQYLILGYPNTGSSEGDAAYEQKMTQRWQNRYVSLKGKMQESIYTYAGQAEIADIVYKHLDALGDLG